MSYAHPASIQARVGSCLECIETNIEQQDTIGVWNFVQLLERYAKVYISKEPDLQTRLNGLPHPVKLRDDEAFVNLMDRVEICLEALHRANIYGYASPPMGSADGLMGEVSG